MDIMDFLDIMEYLTPIYGGELDSIPLYIGYGHHGHDLLFTFHPRISFTQRRS
jgi:hypothetical protein